VHPSITFTFKPEKLAHKVMIITWSREALEKLTAAPVVKKFVAFCEK
jgi:hypothetical protein